MRIVMSTDDFLPSIGGIAAVVWELSRALAARGHEVQVIHWQLPSSELPESEERDSVRILRPKVRWWPNPWRRISWALEVTNHLRPLSKAAAPDIIHSHTFYPDGCAARWYPRPALRVFTNHTSWFLDAFERWWRRAEFTWILKGFDGVLAPSDELAEKTTLCGIQKVRFVTNGVDSERFKPHPESPLAARRTLGLPLDRKIVLVARRFQVKNGVRFAAEAFKSVKRLVPDAMIVFCGSDFDGIELSEVQRIMADEDPDSFRFEGAVANSRMHLYYQASDVSLLPSLQEATSVSGLEAMACGVPVIGTQVGGIPQIVRNDVNGFLVPPRDSEALATKTVQILEDDRLRRRLGSTARQIAVENFSWATVARLTEETYHHWMAEIRR
jgi:glycosyltransferase involved in cell wall biosynthesis